MWNECIRQAFFTDRLDEKLKAFLLRQGLPENKGGAGDWSYLFRKIEQWKQEYLVDSDTFSIASYWMWSIDLAFGVFSLPPQTGSSLEEAMYKIFLIGWALDKERDEYERPDLFRESLDGEFACVFRYPAEACTWLYKQQFLDELRGIYDASYRAFLDREAQPYYKSMEEDYPRFLRRLTFFKKHLKHPEIVRLSAFAPDQYARYLLREGSTVYFAALSDFG